MRMSTASHGSFRFSLMWLFGFFRGNREELVALLRGACGTRSSGPHEVGPTNGPCQARPLRRVRIAPTMSVFEHLFGNQEAPSGPQKRLGSLWGRVGVPSTMSDVHFGKNSVTRSLYREVGGSGGSPRLRGILPRVSRALVHRIIQVREGTQ